MELNLFFHLLEYFYVMVIVFTIKPCVCFEDNLQLNFGEIGEGILFVTLKVTKR